MEKKLAADYIEAIDDVNHPGYENWFIHKEVLDSKKPTAEELKKQAVEEDEKRQ